LEAKPLGDSRPDGIMDSSKLGVMKCFAEDINSFWTPKCVHILSLAEGVSMP